MLDVDWNQLGFEFRPTNCHIEYDYANGEWSEGKFVEEPTMNLGIASTCLHYGQAIFEGLKAFRCKNGEIRVFRELENCKRMNSSSSFICGPQIPEDMFQDAIDKIVKENKEYVPPYGSGGALYIRPLLIGTDQIIGIKPSKTYKFLILVTPVGPYYKEGIKPIDAIIFDEYDRAAPQGAGCYKVAGNYAAGLYSSQVAKEQGYPVVLFLDSKTHTYFEEFTTSNMIAITKDGKYITPKSSSILRSITNESLMQVAKDLGYTVEKRPIPFDEINNFAEMGACGTAVVITPIKKLVRNEKEYHISGEECGPNLKKLYDTLVSIQYGETEDKHNWTRAIPE